MQPITLIEIGCELSDVITESIIPHIQSIAEDDSIDLEYDPEHHFADINESLYSLEYSTSNANIQSAIELAYDEAKSAEQDISSKKEAYDEERAEEEETDHYWTEIHTDTGSVDATHDTSKNVNEQRSIFSDIAD